MLAPDVSSCRSLCDCGEYTPAMSSAKPYIGCKIGLISKAQNRYEGVLYTIDKVNSTVVLAKGEWCEPVSMSKNQMLFPDFLCRLLKMAAQCHFVSFVKHFLSTSQVFWDGGTTH